jgi:hypothetical protein
MRAADQHVFSHGLQDTRETIDAWSGRRWRVLRGWIALSLAIALPELTALFLPLAAWLIASRRGEWNQLLAATLVTVAIAIPALVLAAAIEVYVWPHILRSLSGVHYTLESWTPPPGWR